MLLGMSTGIWVCLMVLAMVIDWIIGDPRWIPHPIVFIGKLISFFEKHLNKGRARRSKGLLMWVMVIVITVACVLVVQWAASKINIILFYLVNLWLLTTTMAERCLKDEVHKVYDALKNGDLEQARIQTGYLVGRDTAGLSEHEIIRAVVETTAENTVDGILAPLFYMTLGCVTWRYIPEMNPLVWAMVYKAVNTMDSMVGYIQEPYTQFGFFPAKLDDGFNFIIARVGSIFMLFAGGFLGYNAREGWNVFCGNRKNHKSPNSAHPESVIAGLLGIQLGGDNVYFGQVLKKPTIGRGNNALTADDIIETTAIAKGSEIVMMVVICLAFLVIYSLG
ncbi:adenosylcobinamide-phosphate synthase CbiB [Eubacterium sp.]|uniref:adenosylcobinamide-phosphate synthase CbiB n=1 Tax=Eubacterium sp. TaxID=142586 RepID=UPI002FC6BDB8